MKSMLKTMLLVGVLAGVGQVALFAQACQDDEEMTKTTLKDLTDLVGAVKKESQNEFEKAYHQKAFLSKSSFGVTVVNGLVDCLVKAAQDSAATKEQADAYKTKEESYSKLKGRMEQTRGAVKSADQKDAKGLIEKLDLST